MKTHVARKRFLLRFRFLLARFVFIGEACADEARRRKLRRPRSHGDESQHSKMLKSTATGRWTTTTLAIVEKPEKAEKQDHFPVSSTFSECAALRKLEVLEKAEAAEREGGGRVGRMRSAQFGIRNT